MIMDEEKYDLEWRDRHIRTFAGRGILLIRNPYHAILSYWNFLHTSSPTAVTDPRLYESSDNILSIMLQYTWDKSLHQ